MHKFKVMFICLNSLQSWFRTVSDEQTKRSAVVILNVVSLVFILNKGNNAKTFVFRVALRLNLLVNFLPEDPPDTFKETFSTFYEKKENFLNFHCKLSKRRKKLSKQSFYRI